MIQFSIGQKISQKMTLYQANSIVKEGSIYIKLCAKPLRYSVWLNNLFRCIKIGMDIR